MLAAHPAVQLAIAGTGVDRERLEARARALRRGAAVRFLGFVARRGAVLRGADVFVSPSWAESFPYVILEAMALGVPIVATRVGGVAEAVQRRRLRRCSSRRATPTSLARALARLLSDPRPRR